MTIIRMLLVLFVTVLFSGCFIPVPVDEGGRDGGHRGYDRGHDDRGHDDRGRDDRR